MRVILPNCRIQFTADDIDFIAQTLQRRPGGTDCLIGLLADANTRDLILDDEALFHALLEHRGCLRVSSHFYFYVMVRNVFRRAGIEDREMADYVAEVLSEYSLQERSRMSIPGQANSLEYFFELMTALQNADERTSFIIRAHIGNHSLFLTGVFPQRILHRAEKRGFPDLSYYEELGRANFRVASDHRLAQRYELGPIFSQLSERFHDTRLALNDISERLFSIGEADNSLDALIRNALHAPGSIG
jgi:hypothetical protein